MELHGALGEIELVGDLLVGKAAEDAVEDLFLSPGKADGALRAVAGFEKLLSFLGQAAERIGSRRDHDEIVLGGLATNHAMHGKEACGMVDREFSGRTSFDLEVGGTRALFVEKIDGG